MNPNASSTAFYAPGAYDNPVGASGRGRTIAAFHLAQGDVDALSKTIEMRRDVLNKLMSPSAVGHWLTTDRLEIARTVGKIQLLRLTSKGLIECNNSLNGSGSISTTLVLVSRWRTQMRNGYSGFTLVHFSALSG